MIVGAIFKLLAALLDIVADPLPEASTLVDWSGNLGELVGEHAGPLDNIVPIGPLLSIIETAALLASVIMVYRTVEWVFRHLPVVGT